MDTKHKQFIADKLKEMTERTSQRKVSHRAQISDATISHMINGKWDTIADGMWMKVKVKLNIDWGWNIAPTTNLVMICDLLAAAQDRSISIAISDDAGLGKTTAYEYFERQNANVFVIKGKNYWTKRSFARHLLIAAGLEVKGTTEEMIEAFQAHLSRLPRPLVIFDQFDKLKEIQKDLFMDFYDELDGHCGFVLSGVRALRIQEERGCRRDRMGYRERYSRYGSRFIPLNKLTKKDVKKICEANGVTDDEVITDIHNNSLGDGRRIRRLVEKYFLTQAESAA